MATTNLTHLSDPRTLRAGRDSGIARLPGLPRVSGGDAQLDAWINAVTERLEVREGSRGNDAERVVTQRELKSVLDTTQSIQRQVDAVSSAVTGTTQPLTPAEALARFADSIRKLKLYQDLMRSLNDPARFDDLRAEVRSELLRSLTEQARKLGADIVQTQKKIQDASLSLAMQVNQLTAAVQDAASGVRQTQFATDELGRAQAGIVTQLQAQLDQYYADGSAGLASLEEQMTVTADRVQGLTSQYTVKVQAGKAVAGIGLSATDNDGVPDSAFIVVANKFALVAPDYAGGLTNLPDNSSIPFGVDAGGIYMNSNVYVKGSMRVDTGGKTLIDGLRGSVRVNAGTGAWSDAAASLKVWQTLGKAGSPPNNNHLVIGDEATMGTAPNVLTRTWNGSAWVDPGVVINGAMIVTGSISAPQINTNNLTIRDASGNVILGAGTMLSANWINSLPTSKITGLGTMATANDARIGSTVKFADGSTMNTADFISRLQRIGSGNIGTFIDGAAITQAYIGNAAIGNAQIQNLAVDTMKIAGGSVTSMSMSSSSSQADLQPNELRTVGSIYMPAVQNGVSGYALSGYVNADPINSDAGLAIILFCNGAQVAASSVSMRNGNRTFDGVFAVCNPGTGAATFELKLLNLDPNVGIRVHETCLTVTGGKR